MRPASTNEKTIVSMDLYRQRRSATAAPKLQEPPEPADEALSEIARYLLMAVRVITSRHH
jgi:hypothetical protein